MAEHVVEFEFEATAFRERANHRMTVGELAADWLVWLEEVRAVRPSTLADYGFLLREPGTPPSAPRARAAAGSSTHLAIDRPRK